MGCLIVATLIVAGRGGPADASPEDEIAAAVQRFSLERPPEGLDEIRVHSAFMDDFGDIHARVEGYRQGIRVVGSDYRRHLFRTEDPERDRLLSPPPDLGKFKFDDEPARLAPEEAEKLAAESFRSLETPVSPLSSELLYVEHGGLYAQTYVVHVSLQDARDLGDSEWSVDVDATSGEILGRTAQSRQSYANSDGRSRHYGTVTLRTSFDGDYYRLEDRTRAVDGGAITATSRRGPDGGFVWGNGVEFLSKTSEFGDHGDLDVNAMDVNGGPLGPAGQTAGVDVLHGAGIAWDFYVSLFGRNGPFADGSPFRIAVHADTTAYSHHDRRITTHMRDGACGSDTDLTILAHEIGHGFYASEISTPGRDGESGGIDEATADIFGKLTEMFWYGGGTGLPVTYADWTVSRCGAPIRYLDRPLRDGVSPNAWSAAIEGPPALDEHHSSGPIRRMFYFLAEGVGPYNAHGESSPLLDGGVAGLGIPLAARVYYDAVTTYLPLHTPKFADLRVAMELSSRTSQVKKAVQDVFAAVGVGDRADRIGPDVGSIERLTGPERSMSAIVTDPSGVERVEYRSGTTSWGVATQEPWSVRIPSTVVSGVYPVDVCALDKLENQTCVSVTVRVDAKSPTILSFHFLDKFAPINGKPVDFRGSDSVELLRAEIVLKPSGSFVALPVWEHNFAPATTAFARQVPVYVPTNLPSGVHTLEAVLMDGALNTSVLRIPMVWDKVPPDLCDVQISPVVGPSTPFVTNTRDAVTGVVEVEVRVDGRLVEKEALTPTPGEAKRVFSYDSDETPGAHTVKVACRDRAGNTSTVTKNFYVNEPPRGTINLLSQTTLPEGHYVWYEVRATDTEGLASFTGTQTCTSTGTRNLEFRFSGPATSFVRSLGGRGFVIGDVCRVWISVTDIHGGQTTLLRDFTVTYAPPTTDPACNARDFSQADGSVITFSVGAKTGYVDFRYSSWLDYDGFSVRCRDGGTINGQSAFSTGCVYAVREFGKPPPPATKLTIACNSSLLELTVTTICWGTDGDEGIWDASFSCAY